MKLGRLKSAGIEQAWQVPLYCPSEYRDYQTVAVQFDPRFLTTGAYAVFKGKLASLPQTTWTNKKPRTQFIVTDGQYEINFSLFGDVRATVAKYDVGDVLCVCGTIARFGSKVFIDQAEIVDSEFVGKIIPVYKGIAGKLSPDNARKSILGLLDQTIPMAADTLYSLISAHVPDEHIRAFLQCPTLTMEQVLEQLHRPSNEDMGYHALGVMTKIAHLAGAEHLIERAKAQVATPVPPIEGIELGKLCANIPFSLTDEQWTCVHDAVESIKKGNLLNALLVGDVGTGKTVVYGLIAAYCASGGHKVAILLPNQNLARQIFQELSEYFFDLGVGMVTANRKDELHDKRIIIGTTALLFQDVSVSLVICDEQQKLATSQREQLRGEHTHILEVSATPIPRTMAFALYGAVKLLRLTRCHADKTIHTNVFDQSNKRLMFEGIKQTIARGKKVIIVCPKCQGEQQQQGDLLSVDTLYSRFIRLYPGKVALCHSQQEDEANQAAIDAMKQGKAQILISTTMTEIGLTIPEVERVSVINAERFGLTQLHQLRGRAVRKGGVGYCDLFLPNQVKNPDTATRMQIMVDTSDGFEIAKADLALRGTGDLSHLSKQQHGAYAAVIKNIKGSLDDIELVMEEVEHFATLPPTQQAS
ncbi:MAG: DEAD/DEAH box helicase [Alteromonadaceae bacterium]|nr:DEAD/DEAH box helicase [Alteromonadaceae bacterium]